jgi:heat shock protein HtpX
MSKRVILLIATNFAIVLVLSIVLFLFGGFGYIGPDGTLDYGALLFFSFVFGMGGAFLSLLISRWIAKRAMGVQLVDGQTGDQTLDWLYRTVARLAQQAQLPMPEVGIYESGEVNAFATGPSKRKSLVAVSTGLLGAMRQNEIEGVLAHEIAHISNGDMVTMTLIQGVVNTFVIFLARAVAAMVRQTVDERFAYILSFVVMILLEIGLGILGMMIVAWYSRAREFRADAGGASLAGRGNMIAALRRLQDTKDLVDKSQPALATLKINGGEGWALMMSTHPKLEARIRALETGGA